MNDKTKEDRLALIKKLSKEISDVFGENCILVMPSHPHYKIISNVLHNHEEHNCEISCFGDNCDTCDRYNSCHALLKDN
jgi:hypothetical protein